MEKTVPEKIMEKLAGTCVIGFAAACLNTGMKLGILKPIETTYDQYEAAYNAGNSNYGRMIRPQ